MALIFDSNERRIIGSTGWTGDAGIFVYELKTSTHYKISDPGDSLVYVKVGRHQVFRTQHRSPLKKITVRNIAKPAIELASVSFEEQEAKFSGDWQWWDYVDCMAILPGSSGIAAYWIDSTQKRAVQIDLSWYQSGYDTAYQGIATCIALPDRRRAVFGMQRSSSLIVVEISTGQVVDILDLGGFGGITQLDNLNENELIVKGYDSLFRINHNSFSIIDQIKLEQKSERGAAQFIGEFCLNDDLCLVARPFSRDILLIDKQKFCLTKKAPVAGQPFEVCSTGNGEFAFREWRTDVIGFGKFS